MTRKIIQIAPVLNQHGRIVIYALANDNTVWRRTQSDETSYTYWSWEWLDTEPISDEEILDPVTP